MHPQNISLQKDEAIFSVCCFAIFMVKVIELVKSKSVSFYSMFWIAGPLTFTQGVIIVSQTVLWKDWIAVFPEKVTVMV